MIWPLSRLFLKKRNLGGFSSFYKKSHPELDGFSSLFKKRNTEDMGGFSSIFKRDALDDLGAFSAFQAGKRGKRELDFGSFSGFTKKNALATDALGSFSTIYDPSTV